jgi:signal peptidase I
VTPLCLTSLTSALNTTRPSIINRKLKTAIIGLYPVFIIFVFSILFFYKSIILGFDIYYIPTHSMKPTLSPGDFVLVNTWIYKHKKPSKKDIVLFVRNNDWDHILIKRIVAESSESIIYNDDTIVEVKKTAGSDALNSVTADGSQIVIRNVPEDYVFVVGDNYRHSQDSRHFGAIRISTIIAKALYTVEIHSEDVYSLRLFHLKAM